MRPRFASTLSAGSVAPGRITKSGILAWASFGLLVVVAGCFANPEKPELVWGRRGVIDGDFVRPRAVVIDKNDRLFVVDFTARIQVYDLDGNYIGPTWTTPDWTQGRPSGLGLDHEGHLIVCDSHYATLRFYDPNNGKALKTIGGEMGSQPGQLGYVSDIVQDEAGNFYVAEFGNLTQRISILDSKGRFVKCWGKPGSQPGRFAQIRSLELGPDGLLYVADSCNHRIQVFDTDGTFVKEWGQAGTEPGDLKYPYDVAISPITPHPIYVLEKGSNRIQKFDRNGNSIGIWGGPGREPGKLNGPWAIVIDKQGRIHVLDSENHRVQRIRF